MMGLNGSYLLEELEEKSKRSHELDFYVLHAVIRFSLAVLTKEIFKAIQTLFYSQNNDNFCFVKIDIYEDIR